MKLEDWYDENFDNEDIESYVRDLLIQSGGAGVGLGLVMSAVMFLCMVLFWWYVRPFRYKKRVASFLERGRSWPPFESDDVLRFRPPTPPHSHARITSRVQTGVSEFSAARAAVSSRARVGCFSPLLTISIGALYILSCNLSSPSFARPLAHSAPRISRKIPCPRPFLFTTRLRRRLQLPLLRFPRMLLVLQKIDPEMEGADKSQARIRVAHRCPSLFRLRIGYSLSEYRARARSRTRRDYEHNDKRAERNGICLRGSSDLRSTRRRTRLRRIRGGKDGCRNVRANAELGIGIFNGYELQN